MSRKILNLEDILTDQVTEEDFLEVPLTDKVFRWVFFCIILVFLVTLGQFFYINVKEGDFYYNRAVTNMSDVKIHPAPRGVIFDRFGKPLLRNEPAIRVFISPHDFPEDYPLRLKALENIASFVGIDFSELKKMIGEKDWGQGENLLLLDDASHEQVVALSALDLKGIYIEPTFKRIYEYPFIFSHILGYTGLVNTSDLKNNTNLFVDDKIGRAGLEAFYDEYVRGNNGKEVFFRNAKGRVEEERSVQEPEPGSALYTFIDAELQKYMYTRLKDALTSLGRDSGAAIAMNPQNGEVLGLVSVPGFDAKNLKEALVSQSKPLFNRAVSGVYNPGSVIKPLVAVAALTEGVIDPKKQIYSAGYIEIPNPYNPSQPGRFLDWKPHGWIDVHSALAKSSNIYFYEVTGGFESQKGIGILKLKEWWQKFNLDKKTNIDLIGEGQGFLPDPEWKEEERGEPWRLGDTYNVAIGQGDFMVTPIGLLNYISAVANGGILYEPRIVKEIVDEKGNKVKEMPVKISNDLKEQISKFLPDVQIGMRGVVSESYGTAHSLSLLPFEVAAKTGTAQIQNNSKVNAFFVGYAPFKNPQIALLILVENAREGSLNTIPVAKDIFLWYYENRLKK
ncbi:MAG: penicillin-binding protein 2 [Patescibacteria group bacterium]